MDLIGFLRDWRRVGKVEVDMEVVAEVVEAKEEEEEKKEKKEKEKEDKKIGVTGKKKPLLSCLVQVCYCYSGACKGGTLCGPVFLFFLIRVL
jgi:hypothetical protein